MTDAVLESLAAEELLVRVGRGLKAGTLIPYLGPGLHAAFHEKVPIPITPEAVAAELNRRAAAPGRIRTNMWGVAQYIEQRRHRRTLIAYMAEIFAPSVMPTPLHLALAAMNVPLIVDTWYDGAMRTALAGRTDWMEIQGITRAFETGDIWYRSYGPSGAGCTIADARNARTVLYKPHGAVTPAQNFLVADSDYVEVLTEIDIQSPIPDAVREMRSERGFVFIGCRFHDQMLRTYARQIAKRSTGPYYAFVREGDQTKNEIKFLKEIGAHVITASECALLPYLV
jgi:hypothetical protein